ncbi:MAG: hypothetical protein ACI81I_000898 [Arcobacteraceae bacterium]|jgi:hypothetical protein
MGIKGKKRVVLNQDSIFKRITDYDIFKFYMPHNDWEVNNVCISPFPRDGGYEKHPSFMIGNRSGNLNFVDFGDTNYKGDALTFVKMLFHLKNMNEILMKIDTDFKLGISSGTFSTEYKKITQSYKQPEFLGKRYSMIQVITRKFTNLELAYWNEYHQDIEDLKREHVYSLSKVYFNRRLYTLGNELRFGYYYDGHWKIYRPHANKKIKWAPNNVPITTMDGKKDIQNCDKAFINKSKKDYMVVKKVFPTTCAIQNEGIACFNEENVNYLKENSNTQILSFDSDVTGVKNSQQITKVFDFDYCNVPKIHLKENINDWAELGKVYGLSKIKTYLKLKQII